MPLLDYQFEYVSGSNTILMGADTDIDVLRVQGLFNMEVHDGDRSFTRTHGDLAGEHLVVPREIFFDIEVIGDPGPPNAPNQVYWDLVYQAEAAFKTTQFPSDTDILTFKVPGLPERFIRARPFRRDFKRNWNTELGAAPMTAVLKAADPRIYGPTLHDVTTSGTFILNNAGNANAYPIMDIVNGGTARLTNNTFGFVFDATSVSGTVIADMDAFIRGKPTYVITVGGVNKYGQWTQPRYPMALGAGDNSFTLNTGTSVRMRWRDTWI